MKRAFPLLILLGPLAAPLACDDEEKEKTRDEPYCHAACSWMAECLQTDNPIPDLDECKDECNDSFEQDMLIDPCSEEILDYLTCSHNKALENGCEGYPGIPGEGDGSIPGCLEEYHSFRDCLHF